MRGIADPPAGGTYYVTDCDIDGDYSGTTVELTLANTDSFHHADPALLPPNARAALVEWLGCVEKPGQHIKVPPEGSGCT